MEPSEVGSGPVTKKNFEEVVNAAEKETIAVLSLAEEKTKDAEQASESDNKGHLNVEENADTPPEKCNEINDTKDGPITVGKAKPSSDTITSSPPEKLMEQTQIAISQNGCTKEEEEMLVQEMCPEKERKFRLENELVHKLEMTDGEPDEDLMVKEYRRSAADLVDMSDKDSLRSKGSLKASIQHLLTNIMMREEPFQLKFDFIDDRLRAVRQELTIQRLTLSWFGCKQLLSCVKFYLIARRLFNTVDTDAVNADRLHACSTRIFECISSISEFVKTMENGDLFGREIQTTRDAFSAMILTRLDDLKPSGLIYSTIFQRISELLSNGVCLLPIELLKAYMTQNWCKFARIFNRLSRIQQIAAEPYILSLRKVCLSSCALSFHNQQLPLKLISSWLILTAGDTRLLLESSEGVTILKSEQEDVSAPFALFNKKEFQLPEHECLTNPAAGDFSFQVLAHMLKSGPEVAPELICNSSPLERVPTLRTNNSDDGRVPVISKNPLDNIASDDDDTPIWMKSGNKSNRKNHRRRDSEKKEKRRDSNREEKDSLRESERHQNHWSEPKKSANNRHRNRNKKDNSGGGSRGARKPGSTASRSWQHDDRTRTTY